MSDPRKKNKEKNNTELAHEYHISFQNPEPKHYTRVPDILDYLTYIDEYNDQDGNVVYERKRLTVHEKELYRILRKTCAQNGCWKSRDRLALEANIGTGTLSNIKKVLKKSFEQLDGKPLIYLTERMIPTVRDNKIINKKPNHFITIQDIWPYNNAYMAIFDFDRHFQQYPCKTLNPQEALEAKENMRKVNKFDNYEPCTPNVRQNVHNSVHKTEAPSPHDPASEALSAHDPAFFEALSAADVNHKPYNHTPYDKESYTPNKFGNCYEFPSGNYDFYDWMTRLGIYQGMQKQIMAKYGVQKIQDTINKFTNECKSRFINNKGAYFVALLRNS